MKEFQRRVLMAVLGVCVCGLAVGFFVYSALGVDPFQVFAHGTWNAIQNVVPVSFGTFYTLVNAAMLVIVFFWNRKKIGLGTLINLFLLGYIAEFSEAQLFKWNPHPTTAIRVGALMIGILVMCFASAMYMTADLGVSTYDAVALTISERHPKLKFKFVRITTDLICVIGGGLLCLLGTKLKVAEIIGAGTIFSAFFMGPLISFFNTTVAEPVRYGKKRETKAAANV